MKIALCVLDDNNKVVLQNTVFVNWTPEVEMKIQKFHTDGASDEITEVISNAVKEQITTDFIRKALGKTE